MEKDNTIYNQEIPYKSLEMLGINRQMADSFPNDVKEALQKGELTPLVQLNIKASNGTVVTVPVRMQAVTDSEGNSTLLTYPAKRGISESTINDMNLSILDLMTLQRGDVLLMEKEGQKRFVQLDPATMSLMNVPEKDVKINEVLGNIDKVKDIELGSQQKQQAREGKPIELDVGGEKVTVGVDLREPQGFKIMRGDMKEWERQQEIKYDFAHPEYVGILQTDQNRWEKKVLIDEHSINKQEKSKGLSW